MSIPIKELRELKELLDDGVINKSEFNKLKKQLLNTTPRSSGLESDEFKTGSTPNDGSITAGLTATSEISEKKEEIDRPELEISEAEVKKTDTYFDDYTFNPKVTPEVDALFEGLTAASEITEPEIKEDIEVASPEAEEILVVDAIDIAPPATSISDEQKAAFESLNFDVPYTTAAEHSDSEFSIDDYISDEQDFELFDALANDDTPVVGFAPAEDEIKTTDALSLEELENDLFGNHYVSTADIEEKKIDKFYTLYRKNEEFQRLLDEEYSKLKGEHIVIPEDEDAIINQETPEDFKEALSQTEAEGASVKEDHISVKTTDELDSEIDTLKKRLYDLTGIDTDKKKDELEDVALYCIGYYDPVEKKYKYDKRIKTTIDLNCKEDSIVKAGATITVVNKEKAAFDGSKEKIIDIIHSYIDSFGLIPGKMKNTFEYPESKRLALVTIGDDTIGLASDEHTFLTENKNSAIQKLTSIGFTTSLNEMYRDAKTDVFLGNTNKHEDNPTLAPETKRTLIAVVAIVLLMALFGFLLSQLLKNNDYYNEKINGSHIDELYIDGIEIYPTESEIMKKSTVVLEG